MPLWRPGTPHGGDLVGPDEYTMWDAAYVLGSLLSAERREFEARMTGCPLCRSAVGELTGLPALLSRLDRGELAGIDLEIDHADRSGVERLLPTELLPSLLAKVELATAPLPRCDLDSWRRRSRGAGSRPVCRRCGPFSDIRADAAAGERVGSADGAGRDEQAGLDGFAQPPAVGNVHLDELRVPGPDERPSRHTGDRCRWVVTVVTPGRRPRSRIRATRRHPQAAFRRLSIESPLCRWFPPTTARSSLSVRCEFARV